MAKTKPPRLLVVDQDARYGQWLKHHLGVLYPESPISVLPLSEFERWGDELMGRDCDILMLVASFGTSPEDPQAQGLELLRRLREKAHLPAVIAVAQEGNELTAVRALQLGAVDYLPKRLLTADRLKTSVKLALRMIEKRAARRVATLAHADGPVPSKRKRTDREHTASVILAQNSAPISDIEDRARTASSPPGSPETYVFEAEDAEASVSTIAAATWAPVLPAANPDPTATAAGSAAPSSDSATASPDSATAAPGDATPVSGSSPASSSGPPASPASAVELVAPVADNSNSTTAPEAAASNSEVAASELKGQTPDTSVTGSTNLRAINIPLPAATAPGGEFMSADFIPGYTIHATIGESEKAAVYVATSTALGHNVALKVSKTLRDEAAGRQFLEREYTAIVAIRDPSVVQIYDYGVHAGYEYLVMEYLPRGDLKARMQQVLTEQETLRYVAQIAAALQVVHQAGLLHRDLKPPNVMLRENGDVALIDFGLARALDGSTPSTRTGVLRGSPYYMSPEQAMGEELDARSDFYSLGIIYYEMLTGKKPYTGGSAMDVLQQHVNAPVPMLPKSLAHHEPLLLKLMAKSRDERFATAEELLLAIAARRELIQTGGRGRDVESSAA